ncbi:MAG TPA: hypothetical protein VHX44_01320, partial [Planctomycetota bacterium]|nr:hypothetical protein [Planctomycetota bacterium]
MTVDDFIARARAIFPDATSHGLSAPAIANLESRFGEIPEQIKELFQRVVYSEFGNLTFVGVRDAADFLPKEFIGINPDFLLLAMDSNSDFFAVRPSTNWELGRVDHSLG